MKLLGDAKFKRLTGITSQVLPDGYVVLLSEATGWAHTLTPAAGMVWEFCDGTSTTDGIRDSLVNLGLKDLGSAEVSEAIHEFLDLGLVSEISAGC